MGSAPRRDQTRNRQRLVEAAAHAVLDDGVSVSLDAVARAAGLGPSTLYRHFPTREDLMEAVLDSLLAPVRATAAEADVLEDPAAAFRHVFARSCVLPAAEVRAIGAIAASSDRLSTYAQLRIEELIEPVTRRAQTAGCLHPGLTAADIAFFVRMVDISDSPERRATAVDVLLRGILR